MDSNDKYSEEFWKEPSGTGMDAIKAAAPKAQPRTKDESRAWLQAYKAKPVVGERLPDSAFLPVSTELVSGPTGWQTIPKLVRAAVWVWSILMLLGVVAFLFGVALWVITAGAVLSQM